MKKIKKIVKYIINFFVIFYFSTLVFIEVLASDLKESILPKGPKGKGEGEGALYNIVELFRDYIFGLLSLVVIGVFIYLGFRLVSARGDEKALKDTLMGFIYVIVGLAIIAIAWVLVTLVVTLRI